MADVQSLLHRLERPDSAPPPWRARCAQPGAAGRGGAAVAARGLPFAVAPGAVVAGYAPIRSEFDPMPLLRKLADAGARLALPVIMGREQPLQFRSFSIGQALERGPLGYPTTYGSVGGTDPRDPAHAARRLRSIRPPHRLWRRLLRPQHRGVARRQPDDRDRPRLRGTGNRRRADTPTRRGAGLCANGNADL